MRVLGMMSGTSLDAIDTALVDFSRDSGDPATLCGQVVAVEEEPWPADTGATLRAVLPPAASDVATWNRLHADVGDAFAATAARVLARHGGADLVATHGQTLHHDARADGTVRATLQIGDASRIAAATGVPVLSDVRMADVAAGGHGAPLVPLLDHLLWGADAIPTAVLNIGGISNVTLVGAGEVIAGDLGPGNALLDAAMFAATGRVADTDAGIARTGMVDVTVLETLLADPFYARPLPRSTGREYFDSSYVVRRIGRQTFDRLTLPDLLATLVELSALTIARGIRDMGAHRVIASGGGIRNPLLWDRLVVHAAPLPVMSADDLGVPADGKEALLMAVLGYFGAHGIPGTLDRGDGTAHTGAKHPVVLGSLTPVDGLRGHRSASRDPRAIERLVLALPPEGAG